MKQSFSIFPERTDKARNAFGSIRLFLVAALFVEGALIFQGLRAPSPQVWTVVIALSLALVCMLAGLVLSRRGQYEVGVWLAFLPLLLVWILAVALISGFGYMLMTMAAVTFIMTGSSTLSARRAVAFGITGVVGAIIIMLVDIFIPTGRIAIPVLNVVANYLTGVIFLVFAFIISRQYRDYSLSTKLIVASLVVALIPLVIIAYFNNRASRTALIDSANQKLYGAAQQTASQLDDFMRFNIEAIRTDALMKDVVEYIDLPTYQRSGSEEEKRLQLFLAALQRQNPIYIDSVAIYDTRGIDVIDTYSADIGVNKSDRTYFKDVMQTGRPLASDVIFSPTTGEASIYFAAPVRDSSGKIIAVLRKRFNAAILQKYLTANNGLVGEGSFPVLLDSHTLVRLAHGNDPALDFKSVIPLDAATLKELQTARHMPPGTPEELSTKNLPDLKAGLENYATQPYFAAEFKQGGSLDQGAVLTMKTQPWLVVFAQPQDIFLAPVTTQANNGVLIALALAAVVAVAGFFIAQLLAGPIVRLTHTAEAVSGGDLTAQARVESSDEIGTLASAFNNMTTRLRELVGTLESRVAERTRNLELAAKVGRTVSQVRALDIMLTDAAELIRKQFDLYYVQVYLTDPSQTNLILQTGTGTVGAELVGRGHRLPLDTASVNGRAAAEKHSVVISDTAASTTFRPNPLLPDTRSEMAVPLLIGERVVGVLDMQSVVPGSLNQDVLSAFEALAGQLAIAIQNANFLAEVERARAEIESQARRLTHANWADYLDAIHQPEQMGFMFANDQVTPLTDAEGPEPAAGEAALTAPLAVTGEPLGALMVEMDQQKISPRTTELVNTIARQVSQQIENLRLLDSAERYRAEAEQASRRLTREGWQSFMQSRTSEKLDYMYNLNEVKPHAPEIDTAAVSLPLKVHDETVGNLSVMELKPNDAEALQLASAIAERLSAHIENLRLSEQTQERAQREQALRQITSAVRGSTDPATILRSAVRELGNLLGRKTIVRLATARAAEASPSRPTDAVGDSAANNGDESVPPFESPNAVGGDK
jgi:GAF domain-containing protein/HAMP domain-containing protein